MLQTLSQEDRDQLLESIRFAAQNDFYCGKSLKSSSIVLNYTALFAQLPVGEKQYYPEPIELRSGDKMQFGDYRGCGSYYALWLRKGIQDEPGVDMTEFQPLSDDAAKKRKLFRERGRGLTKVGFISTARYSPQDFPIFEPRESSKVQNDGKHDLYLFSYPGEYGYSPSTIVSSLPPGYYERDIELTYFDPLLTHSKSHYGKIIEEAKKKEEYANDDNFPLGYIGCEDENESEIQFIPFNEASEDGSCSSPEYFQKMRDFIERHFEIIRNESDVESKSENEV